MPKKSTNSKDNIIVNALQLVFNLIEHLRKVIPPSNNVTFPPKHAVLLGLRESGLEPIGAGGKIPMLYMYGNSVLRDAGPPLAKLLDVLDKSYDAVLTYSGKKISTMLDDVPIPKQCNKDDTVVIHCLGNVSLKETKYYFDDGNWHYKNPEILGDHEIQTVVDCILMIQAKIRKVFKGHIKIIGPFPRILSQCCNDREHVIKLSAPFTSVSEYFFALNHYLAIHPKLDVYGVEFIPVQLIFPEFDESYLSDNIHLSEQKNDLFAEFLNTLTTRPRTSFNTLPYDHPDFYTWAATMRKGTTFQQAIKVNQAPRASDPGASGSGATRLPSTDSAIGAEGMDST